MFADFTDRECRVHWYFGCESPTATTSGQVLPVSARARIADRPIELEVAKTPEQQAMGLMYRTSSADDRGMLFEFKPTGRSIFG